jgi:hypothetical protein
MRKGVYSSFVATLDYSPEAGTMTVEYQNGRTSTHPVTPQQADVIWNAPSVGTALHATIPDFTKKGPRNGN